MTCGLVVQRQALCWDTISAENLYNHPVTYAVTFKRDKERGEKGREIARSQKGRIKMGLINRLLSINKYIQRTKYIRYTCIATQSSSVPFRLSFYPRKSH